MAAGVAVHAVYSIIAAASGAVQAAGAFGHQNLLGLLSHFAVLPAFSLLLVTKKGWPPIVGTASGIVAAILTASRATIGLAGMGLVGLAVLSVARRLTSRKVAIAFLGIFVIAGATPLALMSLEQRYEAKGRPSEAHDERLSFKKAANAMIADYPFGVGPNHYVVITNKGGYSQRAGVGWTSGAALVHHTYLLIAVESGYAAALLFILLLVRGSWVAFRCAFRFRNDARGDLILGLGVALVIVSLHGMYEWVLVTSPAQYLLAINLGLIAGLAQQMGYWRPRAVINVQPPARSAVLEQRANRDG